MKPANSDSPKYNNACKHEHDMENCTFKQENIK